MEELSLEVFLGRLLLLGLDNRVTSLSDCLFAGAAELLNPPPPPEKNDQIFRLFLTLIKAPSRKAILIFIPEFLPLASMGSSIQSLKKHEL